MSSFDSERSTNEDYDSEILEERNPLISSIANVLEYIIVNNKNFKSTVANQLSFFSRQVPQISIEDYLDRIDFYSNCEDSSLIIALIYIDRATSHGKIILNENIIHRLLFTAVFVAIKYNEDQYYKIDYYAKTAGISVKELLILENEFVDLVEFDLYISNEDFMQYQTYLLKQRQDKLVN